MTGRFDAADCLTPLLAAGYTTAALGFPCGFDCRVRCGRLSNTTTCCRVYTAAGFGFPCGCDCQVRCSRLSHTTTLNGTFWRHMWQQSPDVVQRLEQKRLHRVFKTKKQRDRRSAFSVLIFLFLFYVGTHRTLKTIQLAFCAAPYKWSDSWRNVPCH